MSEATPFETSAKSTSHLYVMQVPRNRNANATQAFVETDAGRVILRGAVGVVMHFEGSNLPLVKNLGIHGRATNTMGQSLDIGAKLPTVRKDGSEEDRQRNLPVGCRTWAGVVLLFVELIRKVCENPWYCSESPGKHGNRGSRGELEQHYSGPAASDSSLSWDQRLAALSSDVIRCSDLMDRRPLWRRLPN